MSSGEVFLARLTDAERLSAYTDALRNWSITGYIQFDLNKQAFTWLRRTLSNITLKDLARPMHEYVLEGGEIDVVVETRPEWMQEFEYHYDLRIPVQDVVVYIETRLNYRLPLVADESWILVVNVHAC